MSAPTAIATVTAVLQHMLTQATSGADVSTKPPSAARNGGNGNQLNLFLYATHINSALSNMPLPGQVRNGENAAPPLALVLHYLLTAYGANDDDIAGQTLLGQAMSALHDHPLLGMADIEGIAPDSALQRQIERLRITPEVLSLDDMSKLWSSFQTEYRLSTGYQISVLLIDSSRAASAALPVLRRGELDRGARVSAAAGPVLTGLRFADEKPAAQLGEAVALLGEQLSGDNLTVRLHHASLADPLDLTPEAERSVNELQVRLPGQGDDPAVGATWPAGFYTLSLVVQRPDLPAWTTNALAMPLAPRITGINPASAPAGDVTLAVECLPQVRPEQRVLLIFGNRTFAPDLIVLPGDPSAASSLTFQITNAAARPEPYVLRLRVDGVDSIPVDFTGPVPRFADDQKVTIT
jgi:hypothetical protein